MLKKGQDFSKVLEGGYYAMLILHAGILKTRTLQAKKENSPIIHLA